MVELQATHDSLIDALTQRVRFLSTRQAESLAGAGALKVIVELEEDGIVQRETHLVSLPTYADGAVLSWGKGDAEPDFGALAYRFRKRVGEKVEQELILPTAGACRRYGGTRVRPRASEWTHDLLLAECYVLYQRQADDLSGLVWTSGDTIRSDGEAHLFGGQIPDACLRTADGEMVKVIEACGTGYSKEKLTSLHRLYSGFGYELW